MNLEELNKELGTNYQSEDNIDWYNISTNQHLSEEFIDKHKDLVSWDIISKYQPLTEEFIDKHKDLVNWHYISKYQPLSEVFIDKHKKRVDWPCISAYQPLSEEFIHKHKKRVKWDYISIYQPLSEKFIDKHKNLVVWSYISQYQPLSEEFRKKHKLKLPSNNWLYKTEDFKKEQIKNSGLYECYDDYFIAYKGIRRDRYSNFNFQYQYLPGKTYESHADCSSDENSFGLSVWTEEEARDYCNKLVVKCKVYYKDVARMVHNNGKIRCFKITILN